MAQRKEETHLVDGGPSKLDLMLALFDTELGERTVEFHTPDYIHTHDAYDITVKIISARRRHPTATIWEIEGIVVEPKDYKNESVRVSIRYLSDTRKGEMRFEEELRTPGIMEESKDSKKARALMIVIQKMIALYQNTHRGKPCEGIFKLFETAKRVSYAKDSDSLTEAINEIQ